MDSPLPPVLAAAGVTRVVRLLAGGWNDGAYLVESSHGPAVLKTHSQRTSEQIDVIARNVEIARAAGWTTPKWFAWGEVEGRPWSLQAYIDAVPLASLDVVTARAVVEATERQAGLAEVMIDTSALWDRSDVALGMAVEDRWGHTAELAGFSPQGRTLVERLTSHLDTTIQLPSTDLVHGDRNQANVLVGNGVVEAFVDLDELSTGHRSFDHVDLFHRSLRNGDDPAGREVLRTEVLAHIGVEGFRLCFATTVLGTMRWMVQHMPDRAQRDIRFLLAHEGEWTG